MASSIVSGLAPEASKSLDRLLAETCAQNELFAAAGGRVDGLDGMVGERTGPPQPVGIRFPSTSRDDQAGVVEDEFVCGRTEVQVIGSKVEAEPEERLCTMIRACPRRSNMRIPVGAPAAVWTLL